MSMDINEFETVTHVRKPFEVEVVEVTANNIEALSEHIGELKYKGGTPFIQSDKKKVGNTFKVWPGFFVTVLNGKVRCYSRRIFFEQFVELAAVQEQVEYINGNRRGKPRQEEKLPGIVESSDPEEELGIEVPIELAPAEAVEELEEAVSRCEHGHPEDNCVYKGCEPKPDAEYIEVGDEIAPTVETFDAALEVQEEPELHDSDAGEIGAPQTLSEALAARETDVDQHA